MRRALIYAASFGFLAFLILYFFSDVISVSWISDEKAAPAIRAISFGLPFLSMSSALNGLFTSRGEILKTVTVCVAEDATKIIYTFTLLSRADMTDIASVCAVMTSASAVGEAISFSVALLLYLSGLKKYGKPQKSEGTVRKMLGIALPTAVSAYFRSGLSAAESVLLPAGLRKYGLTETETLSEIGVFRGMAMTVITFPYVLLSSLSRLLLPEISEEYEKGDKKALKESADSSVKTTYSFSVFVLFIFLFFGTELGELIYKSSEAGRFIFLLSPLVPLIYLDGVADSMLKGINEHVASMRFNIVDASLRLALTYFLIPVFGTDGCIIITYISCILNSGLSISRFYRVSGLKFPFRELVFPTLYALASVLPLAAAKKLFPALSAVLVLTVAGCLRLLFSFKEKRTFSGKVL